MANTAGLTVGALKEFLDRYDLDDSIPVWVEVDSNHSDRDHEAAAGVKAEVFQDGDGRIIICLDR